ncbi:MAG TPA: PIN domain-containing protein [Burkholderiales bacterium]|nr:PIN domain-containing protein [Burkholderiales bacterium]
MAAASVLADTSFLISLLSRRDVHHQWAALQTAELPPPWLTCEAVLSEAFHLLGARGGPALRAMLLRRWLRAAFNLAEHLPAVLKLMEKYADVPMSLADACLVRMTETHADSLILTTDADFRVYRRHSRQVLPCRMPD